MTLNPLIVAMSAATAVVIALGYLLLWVSTHRFDRKYGRMDTHPPGE